MGQTGQSKFLTATLSESSPSSLESGVPSPLVSVALPGFEYLPRVHDKQPSYPILEDFTLKTPVGSTPSCPDPLLKFVSWSRPSLSVKS